MLPPETPPGFHPRDAHSWDRRTRSRPHSLLQGRRPLLAVQCPPPPTTANWRRDGLANSGGGEGSPSGSPSAGTPPALPPPPGAGGWRRRVWAAAGLGGGGGRLLGPGRTLEKPRAKPRGLDGSLPTPRHYLTAGPPRQAVSPPQGDLASRERGAPPGGAWGGGGRAANRAAPRRGRPSGRGIPNSWRGRNKRRITCGTRG